MEGFMSSYFPQFFSVEGLQNFRVGLEVGIYRIELY